MMEDSEHSKTEKVSLGGKAVEVIHIPPSASSEIPRKKLEENLYNVFAKYEQPAPEKS